MTVISEQLRDFIYSWSHARLEDGSIHYFPSAEVRMHDLMLGCVCSPTAESRSAGSAIKDVSHRRLMGGENGDK